MLPFEEIFGYAFRKHVARAIESDAAQHVKGDHHSSVATDLAHRPWTGEGAFDDFVRECPFEFVVWLCSKDGTKTKLRGAMDIARNYDTIWYLGSIVDVWLKTPLLTFNRAFPNEINVFKPCLCSVDTLRDHFRLADLLAMESEFKAAFVEGVQPSERTEAQALVDKARQE